MKKQVNRKRIIITCVILVLLALIYGYFNMDNLPAADVSPSVSTVPESEAAEPLNPVPAVIGGVAAMVLYYLFTLLVRAIKKRRKKDTKDQ